MQKNDPKTVKAWCIYDWANSVYSLTITTAVFPSYYLGVTKKDQPDGSVSTLVDFFGLSIENSVLYSYTLSAAFLIVALLSPFLSGIADYTGAKKSFMRFFSTMGAICCSLLFFFNGDNIEYGILAFMFAGVGWAGSLVYYNSYLPEIATEDQYDQISAKGFSLGYIGSVLLLILNLVMILQPGWFFIPEDNSTLGPKISFLLVGLWWFGFATWTFKYLPNGVKKQKSDESVILKGVNELKKVFFQLKDLPLLRKFLIGFFFFSMGVQTTMYLATIFGEKVVGLPMGELIGIVLILQLLAIVGAYGFSWLSSKFGNITSLAWSLVIWVGVCITAYYIGEGDRMMFYILAVFVGMVMGGVQSLARSTYAKFIPQDTEDKTSYFSFYEFTEKISIVLGTFVYGVIEQWTGSMNNSALTLTIFFIAGFIVLLKIPSKTSYNVSLKS